MKNIILMYHSIGAGAPAEAGAELYSVPVDKFMKQMAMVYQLTRGAQGDRRSITITFDDGLLNNYRIAYPVLRDLGLKAYFFIMPEKVGRPGYMNWDKIKEMHGHGMIIGSHGMTHRILAGLDDEDLEHEICESKRLIEKKLGEAIDTFSVPRGFHNAKVIKKVQEAKYTVVFTSNPRDTDGFVFGRVSVKMDWSMDYFQKVLDGKISFREKSKGLMLHTAKKILGPQGYDSLRSAILSRGRKTSR